MSLSGHELKNLASVWADDPLRAVQALPGVASNNDYGCRPVGLYPDAVLPHARLHMAGAVPVSARRARPT